MVLEEIVNPKKAGSRTLNIFFVTIFYTLVAILFANFLFPSESSMLAIALVTIIFVPFFQKLFVLEEEKESLAAKHRKGQNLFARHIKIVKVFAAFFVGIIVAVSFVYIFFPAQSVFLLQEQVIRSFSSFSPPGAQVASASGAFIQTADFSRFFINNTQVMLITYILSILFGAGAVLILAWNASVIGVYIGIVTQSLIGKGYPLAAAYAIGLPAGLSAIALHGIPEVLAYFLAAVAGGVLSVGVIREKWKSREFHLIAKDSIKFLIMAEALIFIAALIEAA
jgi:uncharacterized membrane protein SpoIIM required for sporulation